MNVLTTLVQEVMSATTLRYVVATSCELKLLHVNNYQTFTCKFFCTKNICY